MSGIDDSLQRLREFALLAEHYRRFGDLSNQQRLLAISDMKTRAEEDDPAILVGLDHYH
jgi:hypothetical protein